MITRSRVSTSTKFLKLNDTAQSARRSTFKSVITAAKAKASKQGMSRMYLSWENCFNRRQAHSRRRQIMPSRPPLLLSPPQTMPASENAQRPARREGKGNKKKEKLRIGVFQLLGFDSAGFWKWRQADWGTRETWRILTRMLLQALMWQ